MEAAVGSARWLLDKVVTQLSDNLVAAYVTSTELGLNMEKIKMDLLYTQGLLQTAQEWRDISDNTGLQRLLENLSKKADKAEDVLDELQYFIIQDQIDGTHEATPMVDDGLPGHILHGRHALRHTVGWRQYYRLEEFHVKKERIGFELSELRNLKELRGELKICNLEKVTTREEAEGAKLNWKRNLKTLMLVWGPVQRTIESDVPDGLEPPSNLKELVIKNHGGSIGPSWLCREICVNNLRSLHLEGVSWGTPTPFGQLMQLEELTLIKIASIHKFGLGFGGVTEKSFPHLKKVEFVDMPELLEWVRGVHCHLFSKVASIWCEKCPNLSMLLLQLPSSDCSAAPCAQDINTTWFPNLCDLYIAGCPKLSLPPMPHTSTLTSAKVFGQTGGMLFEKRGWMYMATAVLWSFIT
uniref:R13L1/DRL21-like LRR repeat region domain-containing protein n=1 Tax=Leersia perrieri TaxID=77586 RepID=A0A0D9VEH5_9ORYZ